MNHLIKTFQLTLILILVLTHVAFAGIKLRMQKVSHTYAGGPGSNGTLVVDIYFQNTEAALPGFTGLSNYYVLNFDFAFSFGSDLESILVGAPAVAHTTFFTAAYYNRNSSVTGDEIEFQYSFTGTAPGEMVHTGNQTWNKIATVTFIHSWDGLKSTLFAWLTSAGSFTGWDGSGVQDPDVTYSTIPSDLQDISLPVEMSDFYSEYSYENGIELTWITQSEQNLKGFHVLRSNSLDGEYIRVTNDILPGQGNSSAMQEYTFSDPNVEWNTAYYYKLYEISSIYQDTSKTYFGPVLAKTDPAPTQFELSDNFPNPFNPATEIKFQIVEGGMIDLSVYNLLGQKISSLVHEEKPAGIYTVPWFGLNDKGQEQPSGVYLYRLTAPEGIEVKKMMKVE